MKFSVLMSVYFKENPEYFDLALQSNLSNQSLKPDEFVLVCDGQLNDGLERVIEKWAGLYPEVFKVYRLSENRGLGEALNYGLEKCTYEIVARSDSDDVCAAERFEKQIEFLKNNEDIAVLGTAIDEFESNPDKRMFLKLMPTAHAELYEFAKFRSPLNHMSVMFRKSVVKSVGSYVHMKYLEDYYLWLRILIAGYKIANLGDVLVHARVGNGMVYRRSSRDYISGWGKLSRYMLESGMINRAEYLRNVLAVRTFIYMPPVFKKVLYRLIRNNHRGEASCTAEF